MRSTRGILVFSASFALANAFTNFDEEPRCVPADDVNEEMLPFVCKFDPEAEYDPGFDCTDIPEQCTSANAKGTWAFTKIYVESQGTSRFSSECSGLGNVLTRDIEFPECVYGEPVPERRVRDLVDVIVDARQFVESVLARNPTPCAERVVTQIQHMYSSIYNQRISKVSMHGLKGNTALQIQQHKDKLDMETNACTEETQIATNFKEVETLQETSERLANKDYKFSRDVLNEEECTFLSHYDGSTFAKPHPGGLNGCKWLCDRAPECNAFNLHLSTARTTCDLLACPSDVSRVRKDGFFGFVKTAMNTNDEQDGASDASTVERASMEHSEPLGAECVKPNTAWKGKSKSVEAESPDECFDACEAMSSCDGWSWLAKKTLPKKPCKLFERTRRTMMKKNTYSGSRTCHPVLGEQ